jgi:hypothetical protein
MNPFYFGPASAQLYGVYYPAASGAAGDRGVVICQSIGQEYLRAHWVCTQIALGLSRRGVHALLFDYFGQGDSAGGAAEGTANHWVEDIAGAVEELKDLAGLRQYGLVGVRFGAALASEACAIKDLRPFAMGYWDPVLSGGEYLLEMETFQKKLAESDWRMQLAPEDSLIGFRMDGNQRESIRPIDRKDFHSHCPAPFFIAYSEKTPHLLSALESGRRSGQFRGERFIPEEAEWFVTESYDKVMTYSKIPEALVKFMADPKQ